MVRSRAQRGVSNHGHPAHRSASFFCRRHALDYVQEAPMNVQLPLHIDKPAFLEWVQGREGRYELAEGRVVMMVGASRNHGIIVGNLFSLIKAQLDAAAWTVIHDFGLDAGPDTLRYPDIVVDRAGGRGSDFTATAPVLLAEVLSPSTADIDLGDKAVEYLRLPGLSAYLVMAQAEPKAWVWQREAEGDLSGPHAVAGLDKVIHVVSLRLALPLGAIYAGIF
jgi:Uma2 family endonuclease